MGWRVWGAASRRPLLVVMEVGTVATKNGASPAITAQQRDVSCRGKPRCRNHDVRDVSRYRPTRSTPPPPLQLPESKASNIVPADAQTDFSSPKYSSLVVSLDPYSQKLTSRNDNGTSGNHCAVDSLGRLCQSRRRLLKDHRSGCRLASC